jgi:erythromycin esterase
VAVNLAEHVVALDGIDPGADLLDLRGLEDVFADRRVIGLNEATHGTREFFQFKHRLVRFLVKELGSRPFGIEANFSETLPLDTYVVR